MKETHTEKIDRYIREGRTVSGGDASPPGKPGSVVVSLFLDGGDPQLLARIVDFLRGEGFTTTDHGDATPTSVLMERGYNS